MKTFEFKDPVARSSKGPDMSPERSEIDVVTECFCHNGHSLITDLASFGDFSGISLKLKGKVQEGMLSLSPVIGDKSRTFFNFSRQEGEIINICCPTCSEPFPIYNLCSCGAYLVAMFTNLKADFADCIGICQRIGCLHSEIKTNRALRLYSRNGFFA